MRITNDSPLQQPTTDNNVARNTSQNQNEAVANSAFQPAFIPTNNQAASRSRESLNSAAMANQLRNMTSPSLDSLTKNAASAMRPATGGGTDSIAVTKTATPNAAIRDLGTTTSAINFPAGSGDVQNLSVNVNIAHTYRGDLVVKLVSPSGKEAILTNKAGGSADNFVLSAKDLSTTFAGQKIDGDWKLVVQDTAAQDVGTLKSWGMSVEKKPAPGGGGGGQTGATNLQITGDAAFRTRAGADLAKFAPGTTVDAQGYVHAATTRTPGHDQGYKLIDTLLAGGTTGAKKVTIGFTANNAFTSSGTGATGTASADGTRITAGAGSDASVSYDPALDIALPTLNANGTISDQSISSEVVLAHELTHAIHAQAGTIDRSLRDHTFTDGATTYKENWRFEELRTTGFAGFRQGNEPSENSIRAELGFGNRATYLDRSSWTRVSGVATNSISANTARAASASGEQLVGDAWRSGGAALPNGQFRICNCFAC